MVGVFRRTFWKGRMLIAFPKYVPPISKLLDNKRLRRKTLSIALRNLNVLRLNFSVTLVNIQNGLPEISEFPNPMHPATTMASPLGADCTVVGYKIWI